MDTLDLYASSSRAEFAQARGQGPRRSKRTAVEAALLALLVEAEKTAEEEKSEARPRRRP